MVSGIDLPHGAEALARRSADDHVHRIHAKLRREFGGREGREVFAQRENFLREVGLEGRDGFLVEINRRKAAEARAGQPEAESPTPAEEIEESRCAHLVSTSQSSSGRTPSALQSLSTVLIPGLRTPRSIPLR